jgi:hypothetical protein
MANGSLKAPKLVEILSGSEENGRLPGRREFAGKTKIAELPCRDHCFARWLLQNLNRKWNLENPLSDSCAKLVNCLEFFAFEKLGAPDFLSAPFAQEPCVLELKLPEN